MLTKLLIIINYILTVIWAIFAMKYLVNGDPAGVGMLAMAFCNFLVAERVQRL